MNLGPVFLKIKGGWINPEDIVFVETMAHNELMFKVGITGREKPIILNETDSAMLGRYMMEHAWLEDEEDEEYTEGVLEDAI